jgi:hypothetical protein
MTPMQDNPTLDDDRRFDLLADGELGEAERRELLTALEQEPGGWRRCALAFLEAQCWRQTMRTRTAHAPREEGDLCTPHAPREGGHHAERDEYKRRHMRRLGVLAAMAASFLIALTAGTQLPRFWNGRNGAVAPTNEQVADRPAVETPRRVLPQTDADAGAWRTVTLSMPDGPQGSGRSIELPACERASIDPAWVRSIPSAITPELAQSLQQSGYEIRQRRGVLPFEMNDGRRLVVPVDRVEVHYVGNPAY